MPLAPGLGLVLEKGEGFVPFAFFFAQNSRKPRRPLFRLEDVRLSHTYPQLIHNLQDEL